MPSPTRRRYSRFSMRRRPRSASTRNGATRSAPPQCILTMPLLEGLDGVNKMSKSLGNYVGINEKAEDIFGKLMSISDELMWKYYELLTDEDVARIKSD